VTDVLATPENENPWMSVPHSMTNGLMRPCSIANAHNAALGEADHVSYGGGRFTLPLPRMCVARVFRNASATSYQVEFLPDDAELADQLPALPVNGVRSILWPPRITGGRDL
jgi:hypothetical protein